jgi:hypothetical protein
VSPELVQRRRRDRVARRPERRHPGGQAAGPLQEAVGDRSRDRVRLGEVQRAGVEVLQDVLGPGPRAEAPAQEREQEAHSVGGELPRWQAARQARGRPGDARVRGVRAGDHLEAVAEMARGAAGGRRRAQR